MDASQIRYLGATLKARLMSSQHKKGKGRTGPLTSTTVAPLIATVTSRGDLSYFPPPIIVLGAILRDVLLVTDAGVPLPSIGSS